MKTGKKSLLSVIGPILMFFFLLFFFSNWANLKAGILGKPPIEIRDK